MKLVLFDCDGTLVDSQHMIVAAMEAAFAAHSLAAPPRERILGVVGLSLPIAIRALIEEEGDTALPDLIAAYAGHFGQLRREGPPEPLYPHAAETIAGLAEREDTLLGVVTGKSRRGLDAVLAAHGLDRHFITLMTADDAPSKPAPEMVLQAAAEAGVDPRDAVVVGDTTFDIEMARAAGAGAIGVGWGYHPAERLTAAGAETVLAGFPDLVPWLDQRQAMKMSGAGTTGAEMAV